MRPVRVALGWLVPLTAGFPASGVVSALLAVGITAMDLTGVLSVALAVGVWCVVVGTAARLYPR